MLILSTKTPVRWTPPWLEGQDGAPTFLFRAGSVIDRAELEAELAGEHRAGRVFDFELAAAFTDGVTTLLAASPADAAQLIEWGEAERAGEPIDAEARAALAEARDALEQYWPAYRTLIERSKRRLMLTPVVAFRRFCVGWEGAGLPDFAKGVDARVTLDCAGGLDPLLLQAAGSFAYSLLYTSAEKKSERPSRSGEGPPISSSDTAKAGGKSPAKDGRATRSSK